MEEYAKLGDADAEPRALTFCDNCNPDQTNWSGEGLFEGPASSALDNGWTETDFGHLCLPCSIAEAKLEEMGNTSVTLEQALAQLDPNNPILKMGIQDWASEAQKVEAFHQMAKEELYERLTSEKGMKSLAAHMGQNPDYDWQRHWDDFATYLGRELPSLPEPRPVDGEPPSD